MILAIDPGNEESAYVRRGSADSKLQFGKVANEDLLASIRDVSRGFTGIGSPRDTLVVEMIASYGMPVGAEVFETCVMIGRLIEAWPGEHAKVYRREVKLHLCGSARAKDGNVRQALIDRYGGKHKAIGKKRTPGPLYGISADVWQALAVAVTYADTTSAVSSRGDAYRSAEGKLEALDEASRQATPSQGGTR